MQSGPCSFSRLEMASKKVKKVIFKNAKKIKNEGMNNLETLSTKDISASRRVFKESKLVYIKKSTR